MSLLLSRTYQQHPLFAYFTAFDYLARYALLNLTFALCLNLLVGYCSSSKTIQRVYCGTFSYLFLLCFWFLTGGLVIISYLLNCKRLFDNEMFVLLNNCDRSDPSTKLGTLTTTSDGGSRMYPSPIATTTQRIPLRRNRISRNRQLLNQATLLCIVYIIDFGLYRYGPYISPTLQATLYFKLINIARNCIQILCQISRPLIFYFFDSEINSKVKKFSRQIFKRNPKIVN
uniref:G-protein coupled receptors family 1 profile domain-containing protein n=1 Tax=Panagrolaimus davidi TaxID=227884 RepID=A0A914PRQ0_9BILA